MLADYANQYMVPFNCLGIVVYFQAQKPVSQQQSSGIYFEGITLKNSHLNTETGELQKALVREFEFVMPLMKLRVQCIRSSTLDSVDSIPIIVRAKNGPPLERFKTILAHQTPFTV